MPLPRDLLNARHAAAEPRLDALRRAVIADLATESAAALPWWSRAWHEVFFVSRHAWCGLAATWLLIALWEFSPAAGIGTRHPAPTVDRELSSSIASQRELLRAELGTHEPVSAAPEKRPLPPSGRLRLRRDVRLRETTVAGSSSPAIFPPSQTSTVSSNPYEPHC